MFRKSCLNEYPVITIVHHVERNYGQHYEQYFCFCHWSDYFEDVRALQVESESYRSVSASS